MQCFRCHAENVDGARFCGHCGAAFVEDTIPSPKLTDPTRELPPGALPPSVDLPQLSRGGTPKGWGSLSGASLDGSLRVPVSRGARVAMIAIVLTLDAAMATGGVLLMLAGRRGGGGAATDAAVVAPDATLERRVLADGGVIVVEVPPVDAGRRGTGSGVRPGTGTGTAKPVPDAAPVVVAPDAAPVVVVTPDAGAVSADATLDDGSDTIPNQINSQHSGSRSRLSRCYTQATKGLPDDQPLDGEVDISFEVMPTGEVKNIHVVRNTTLSTELSDCIVAIVGDWSVTPYAGEPVELKKTFGFHPR